MIRGNNRQTIFFDDMDRRKFVREMARYSQMLSVEISAYCLMTNHVHMLIKYDQTPGDYIQRLSSSYVYYFNHKYSRIGHLFQGRYKSEVVEDESYLLTCAKYIILNPEKAGICKATEYNWSSWTDIDDQKICNMELLFSIAGGKSRFVESLSNNNVEDCLDVEENIIKEDDPIALLQSISGLSDLSEIKSLPKKIKYQVISDFKQTNISIREISRITGISKSLIQYIYSL